jgi:NTP pyrophosphatase (non-canonical NTP hydrolase)
MNQVDILNSIIKERKRQDILHPHNKKNQMLSILIEEVGEVGKAMNEGTNLEEELIHSAAVIVRWLEML